MHIVVTYENHSSPIVKATQNYARMLLLVNSYFASEAIAPSRYTFHRKRINMGLKFSWYAISEQVHGRNLFVEHLKIFKRNDVCDYWFTTPKSFGVKKFQQSLNLLWLNLTNRLSDWIFDLNNKSQHCSEVSYMDA